MNSRRKRMQIFDALGASMLDCRGEGVAKNM
jgi:hypothetical protein